jgi:hypothetical protein
LVLSGLGKAPDLNARVAAVEAEAARAKALLASAGRETPAPPGALCRGAPSDAARRLHDALATQSAQAGLAPESLDVSPEDGGAGPTPLRVRLTATGSYEAALGLLTLLAKTKPLVFADSVDLTPKISNVTLAFTGRAFCAS